MAGRPKKSGLEYFPHDVHTCEKLEYIEAVHGIVGYGVFWKLLERIYANGYYLSWTEKVLMLTSKAINVDRNTLSPIISDCINEGLFNHKLHKDYQILTSPGIQRRYLNAIGRREKVEFIQLYALIDISGYSNLINVDINPINVDGNYTKYSKVKYSKRSIYSKRDFLILYAAKINKFTVSKSQEKQMDILIKAHGIWKLKFALDRFAKYRHGKKDRRYCWGNNWGRFSENIGVFLDDESYQEQIQSEIQWKKKENNERDPGKSLDGVAL